VGGLGKNPTTAWQQSPREAEGLPGGSNRLPPGILPGLYWQSQKDLIIDLLNYEGR